MTFAGRCLLLAGAAFFSAALTEPQPVPGADPRYRTVEWRDGIVIQAFAHRGKVLMIELPRGMEILKAIASDQDVMKNVVRRQERGQPDTNTQASPGNDDGCTVTNNLQTCISNDRFIFFKPITDLDVQPISVIAARVKQGAEPVEYNFIVEISAKDENTPYYAVRVTFPGPAPVVRGGGVRRSSLPRIAAPEPPPPVVNNQYRIEGDTQLLGVPER